MSNLTDFLDTVNSVSGRKGNVTLTKTDVGLANVPNVDATNINNLTGVLPVTKGGTGTTTLEDFKTALNIEGGIPAGVITLWSGSIATIPGGWALCDGANGTPNLRDRFIVGAGSTYAVGATGGSANAVVVAHTHTGSTNSTGAHTHNQRPNGSYAGTGGRSGFERQGAGVTPVTASAGAHSHTVSINSAGESGVGKNLPPYYALAYIMKL